jgi:hypothetical protein
MHVRNVEVEITVLKPNMEFRFCEIFETKSPASGPVNVSLEKIRQYYKVMIKNAETERSWIIE